MIQELGCINHTMQIGYHGFVHAEEDAEDYDVTRESLLNKNVSETLSDGNPKVCKDNLVPRHLPPFCPASRPFDLQLRDCQSARKFNLNTPILVVYGQSRKSTVKTIRSSKVYTTTEEELTVIVYPNSAGRYLGITRGMLISANSMSGWRYQMQPLRAVEETALVFEFCREGNIQGLRSLFARNEASPWDRDPKGQTPLLVRILTS